MADQNAEIVPVADCPWGYTQRREDECRDGDKYPDDTSRGWGCCECHREQSGGGRREA